MIRAIDVYKRFADKEVLKGISADFLPGNCNLIIGKSGAGKTVLMKCLIGLFVPDRGRLEYDGVALNEMKPKDILHLRTSTGMLFQGSALFDSMTVLENVMFPMEMFTNMSHRETRDKALGLLDRVGLNGAEDKYPAEISGGMMKRTAIARAIALDPIYLFCDEPNSGLDPTTSIVIDNLIRELTKERNMTTIINTHDMHTVKTIGDQILYLRKGQISWRGSSATLQTEGNESVLRFINSVD